MRVAEELLLLATDPSGGRSVLPLRRLQPALAAALLADLVLLGRARLEDGRLRAPRDPATTGDANLDEALVRVVRHPGAAVPCLVSEVSQAISLSPIYERLIEEGAVAEEARYADGRRTDVRWPELSPAARKDARARLDALLTGRGGDERTVALLAVAHACGLTELLFPDASDLDERVTDGTAGHWAGKAAATAIAGQGQPVGAG
jgi:hypothetical protein